MGKREQGESCPALSPILREVDLVLVLLLFLNLIFLYVDSIFIVVLLYCCIIKCLYFCIMYFLYFSVFYFFYFL